MAGLKYSIDTSVKSSVRTDATGAWVSGPSNGVYRVKDVRVYDGKAGVFVPMDPNAVYRVVGNAFTLVEGGDGFAMFRSAKVVENALVVDYLALADYAKAFGKAAGDEVPRLASALSPLAALANYPISYEKPHGSGRISLSDRR